MPRSGIRTGFHPKFSAKKRIWVHALSVGEVISVLPFIKALKDRYDNLDIVFTASTRTGFEMAKKLFLNPEKKLADQLGYFPFDLGWCIKKIKRQIEPDAVILVETDMWPGFLYEMKKKKIPVILINARLSRKSLRRYLFFKPFSLYFFAFLTSIMAQTSLDKDRFQQLGVSPHKISVVGNIKFDQPHENMDEKEIKYIKKCLKIQTDTQILVAGSTHEGEEKILSRIYQKQSRIFPGFLMIIAPRDPERSQALLSYFLSNGIHTVLWSQIDKYGSDPMTLMPQTVPPEVILVDRMGVLCRLYSVCDLAFIGGSMVQNGGHNPLEAAAFSKPVLFGKDMSDFLLISDLLLNHGGAIKVCSEQDLQKQVENLLKNRKQREYMGIAGYEVFLNNMGAVQIIIRNLERLHIV